MGETSERLIHIIECQREIISKQKEIEDATLSLLLQHISADAEELKPIIDDINEMAKIRAEY